MEFAYFGAFLLVMISTAIMPCLAEDQSFSAEDLTYITEQYPPYNFQQDGKLRGIVVDLLEKVWERMGADLNRSAIEVVPWTEGYQRTLQENNTVLFTTFRLPLRENLFKWAGPVASGRDVLLVKGDNVSIADPSDLKKYRIAGIRDDIAVRRLLDLGVEVEDLVLENVSEPIIEMLENGSVDGWAYNELAGIWLIQQSGVDIGEYRVAYVIDQGEGYYAFNNGTPDSTVQAFQEAIDYIKSNNDTNGLSDFDQILAGYIPATIMASSLDQNEVIAFVNEAIAYADANGQDKALQEFNDSDGSFVRKDLYIFAYDLNGTCIAHPINPSLVGQTGLSDTNGIDIVGRELALAKRGGGTLYIVFPNPAHGGKEELKQLFIEDVNDRMYLGSGLYLSLVPASFDQEEISELMAYVNEARLFAQENGKQKALEAFNDPEGIFTVDGRYIFAYDYEGRNLALPFQPELVGKNRIDVKDPNGVYFVQQLIDVAKMGNGSIYYIYPDPSRNMIPALKLSFAASVDDTWFIGSGIYAKGEEEDQ